MKKLLIASLSSLAAIIATSAMAQSSDLVPAPVAEPAWDILEGLTTEIGPRLAGTEAEARARRWAVNWLIMRGFRNVRDEPFQMPTWVRGEERAALITPFPHRLAITALGNSGSTGPRGLEGEVVYFASHAALVAASDAQVRGKIVFIDHAMRVTQDGSSYGFAGPARWTGPNIAASKGAVAVVIRSIGTDNHRNPHTGNTNFAQGVSAIPAGAISNPDADVLVRSIQRSGGAPMRMQLLLTPRNIGQQTSGNVVAELPGRDPSLAPVLIACHLDSWDLGTGAVDDAAGCAITTAAALRVAQSPEGNLRTIRVLWAGAEEVGVWGGKAYAQAHAAAPHYVAMESDFGAGRVWQIGFNFAAENKPLADRLAAAVAPHGVGRSSEKGGEGADIAAIVAAQKLPGITLHQDGTRYFDLHHTPDDTLDPVNRDELAQNVTVWSAVLAILANEPGDLKAAQ